MNVQQHEASKLADCAGQRAIQISAGDLQLSNGAGSCADTPHTCEVACGSRGGAWVVHIRPRNLSEIPMHAVSQRGGTSFHRPIVPSCSSGVNVDRFEDIDGIAVSQQPGGYLETTQHN